MTRDSSDFRLTDENPLTLLRRLVRLQELDDLLPDPTTPFGKMTFEFFSNNWINARDGLLRKTQRLRARPRFPGPAPRVFSFEADCKYKRKRNVDDAIQLVDGPLRGTIRYRPDLFIADPEEPSIAVFLDPDQHFYHPNHARALGLLCTGALPWAFPLDLLLEHIHLLVSYQHWSASDPADLEAARYFALDPDAMRGLEHVEPLF